MVKYNSEVLESLVDINSNSLEIIRATSDQLFSFNEASFNFFFDSIQPDAEFLFARVRKLKITSQSHIYDRSNPITTRNIEAMIGLFEHIIVGDEKLECVALELEAYESSDPLPSLLLLCGSQSRLNDLNISIFQLSDFSKFQDSIFTENSPVSIIKNLAFHYNRVGFVDRKLFSLFPNLERLDLARNKIKILGKDVFRSAGSLTRLDLSKNEIDCLSEDSFQGLDNLKVLKVKAKSVDRRAFIHLLRLECLELCESPLKSIESDTFVDLPKLKKLNLASCSINSIDSRAFDNLSSLEELNISDNNLKIFETKSPVRILNASDNKNLALVKLNGDNESKVEVVQLLNNSIGTDLVSFFPMSQLQMLVITPTDEIRFDQFTCLEKLVLLLEDLGMLKRDQFNSLTNLKTLILRSSFSG
jgi:Leucine-rich repeat (LRR) protein